VSEYFLNTFSDYTNRTISDYLEIRFKTNNPQVLADRTYTEVMMPLNNKATPLFWLQPGYSHIDAVSMGFCVIPYQAVMSTAANYMAETDPTISVIPNDGFDGVAMLQIYAGVPLCAYAGLAECYECYQHSSTVGRHLYEKTSQNGRDWRKLNDLVPWSLTAHPTEKQQRAADIYDEGEKLGTVVGAGTYKICILEDIAPMIEQANIALDRGNVKELQDALLAVKRVKVVEMKDIPNDAALGYAKRVSKDYVVASDKMTALISQENKKRNMMTELKKKLEGRIMCIGEIAADTATE
jgi:hypothetical protein